MAKAESSEITILPKAIPSAMKSEFSIISATGALMPDTSALR